MNEQHVQQAAKVARTETKTSPGSKEQWTIQQDFALLMLAKEKKKKWEEIGHELSKHQHARTEEPDILKKHYANLKGKSGKYWGEWTKKATRKGKPLTEADQMFEKELWGKVILTVSVS